MLVLALRAALLDGRIYREIGEEPVAMFRALGTVIAVAIAFGLVHTNSAADERERQGSSRAQPTTEDLILVEAERFRSDLWDIFSNYSNLAQTFGKSDRDPVIEQAIRSANNLSDDDALFLLSSGVDLEPLLQQVQNANAIVVAAARQVSLSARDHESVKHGR